MSGSDALKTPEVTAARDALIEAINAGADGRWHWTNLELRIDLLMVKVEHAARKAQILEDYETFRVIVK